MKKILMTNFIDMSISFYIIIIRFSVLSFAMMLPTAAFGIDSSQTISAFQQGHFRQAIANWETVLSEQSDECQSIDTLTYLASAYQALGLSEQALATLNKALQCAEKNEDNVRHAMVQINLTDLYLRIQQLGKAAKHAKSCVQQAHAVKQPILLATAFNNLGNVLKIQQPISEALSTYIEAMAPIEATNPEYLRIKTLIGVLQTKLAKLKNEPESEPESGNQCHSDRADKQRFEKQRKFRIRKILAAFKKEAERVAEKSPDNYLQALIYGKLGKWYKLNNQPIKAKEFLRQALFLAQRDVYLKASTIAQHYGNPLLRAKALTNLVQVAQKFVQEKEQVDRKLMTLAQETVQTQIKAALTQTHNLPDSHEKLLNLLALLEIGQTILSPDITQTLSTALHDTLRLAQVVPNIRVKSLAYGQLGYWYGREKRSNEALSLTRQALFLAEEEGHSSDIAYRWQWQLGKLKKAQADIEGAISSYRQAVTILDKIQPTLISTPLGGQSFYHEVAPVYFEFTDLLLQVSANNPNQTLLKEAIETIEAFKKVELTNYFQDDCVTKFKKKIKTFHDNLPPKTAALYPILLPNRTELLLSLPGGRIEQITKSLPSKTQVSRFLRDSKNKNSESYKKTASYLYELLITPIESHLMAEKVDTLIIIPHGKLYQVPFAALYDGKKYLIEKYALVTTPALTLTAAKGIPAEKVKMLVGGLTESVQGFKKLCYVTKELEAIKQWYSDEEPLENQSFTAENVQTKLEATPYNIVHLATHGIFNSNPKQTFLLTYDNQIKLQQLEKMIRSIQFRKTEDALELLTLSACETAKGDNELAALGLAGIAVKAGARSALASLWKVNDNATAILITEFYQQLMHHKLGKAKALQKAQIKVLKLKEHPTYWAAFILVGNWL